MDPPQKVQNPASSSAIPTVLIFACIFKGLLSEESEYKLMVPASVAVQCGLCVHIPCSFTSASTGSEKLYGYWFQEKDGYEQYFVTSYSIHTISGFLVASNDKRVMLKKSVENRFQLTGKLTDGSCSLSILNAKSEDTGEYIFRIESSKMAYSYATKLKVLVTELTENPQIRNYSVVLSEMEAVFTCSAPGPCFTISAKISWTTILLDYTTSQWSQQHNNGSWTYRSNFTFTPSLKDQGKWLTCRVWYPNVGKQVENTIFLDVADPAQTYRTAVNKTRLRRPAAHNETWGSLVMLLLIILYLFKLLVCFLFFVSVFWLCG